MHVTVATFLPGVMAIPFLSPLDGRMRMRGEWRELMRPCREHAESA